jgi:HEAT repeat protein
MSLESYFTELVDSQKQLVTSKLTKLSAMPTDELKLFHKSWPDMPEERRREILSQLTLLAEGDPDLDFKDIFLTGLKDPDESVRLKSLDGLWEYERSSFIGLLIDMLKNDKSDLVRASAALSLGKFVLLAEFGKLRAKDGEKVRESLIATIQNDQAPVAVKRRAVESISCLNLPVVTNIILKTYKSGDESMKASALYAMGMNNDPVWLPILLKELNNPDPELRFEAARACGEFEDAQAVPQLLRLIRDPDSEVGTAAIISLGKIGGDAAEATLRECAESHEDYVRDAAADALRELNFNKDPFAMDS